MWNEFNIKTFPAETIVFRDGVYCGELSTLPNAPINKNYDLPVHVIYVGEIVGENNLEILVGADNQKVCISANVKIKKPAFLNIFIICGPFRILYSGPLSEDGWRKKYICRFRTLQADGTPVLGQPPTSPLPRVQFQVLLCQI